MSHHHHDILSIVMMEYLLYPIKILKQIIYLPKTAHQQYLIKTELEKNTIAINKLSSSLQQQENKIKDVEILFHSIDEKMTYIKHVISVKNTTKSLDKDNLVNNTVSDNHYLDYFYKLFEDKFRGTEKDIKSRVSEYKSLFDSLPANIKNRPIIDLGCGRGEFLSFAKDNGLNAVGVDMNHDMVNRAKSLGFNVIETDATSYITNQNTNSIAAITGFHIVEHIPFDSLMRLFEECYRVLSPEGFVLFETPNPKNLITGASNFYIDPSHTKPIPPELLSFALESVGFKTEIISKHPAKEHVEHNDKDVAAMMQIIYGPQDYAVLGKKS